MKIDCLIGKRVIVHHESREKIDDPYMDDDDNDEDGDDIGWGEWQEERETGIIISALHSDDGHLHLIILHDNNEITGWTNDVSDEESVTFHFEDDAVIESIKGALRYVNKKEEAVTRSELLDMER